MKRIKVIVIVAIIGRGGHGRHHDDGTGGPIHDRLDDATGPDHHDDETGPARDHQDDVTGGRDRALPVVVMGGQGVGKGPAGGVRSPLSR